MTQSTKGMGKHFIVLSVALAEQGRAGELQRFEYVSGDKFKTRKAAIRHAETARMRWQDNYAQYRGASFSITDTAELPKPTPNPLARLRHHVTGAIQRGEKQSVAGISVMSLDKDNFDPEALHSFIARGIGEA